MCQETERNSREEEEEEVGLFGRVPFLVVFPLGVVYFFVLLNFSYWIMFGVLNPFDNYLVSLIYLIPIVFLSPGWLMYLYNCKNWLDFLKFNIVSIIACFGVNFMAHYLGS